MGVLLEIVNIFVIPLLSVYIYTVRMNKPRKFNFDTVMIYAFFVPVLMVCTKAVAWIFDKDASLDGWKYAVIAIFAACLLPFACEMIKKAIHVRLTIEKAEQ